MKYCLEVENLSKEYKGSDFRLENVSFSLPSGSIMGFVGKNGAGKTTTINAILNVIQRDSGTIRLFGQEMTDSGTEMRNEIGVVFDAANFSQELTAAKLEKVFSDIYQNWDRDLFFSLLNRFELPLRGKIKTFSRGMTMKLSIIVALSHQSKLLILDEATSGLDPVVREEILDLFLEFVENEDHSIFMSSHLTGELEKIADYITFLHQGQILLSEKKDVLIYEYGIVRCKAADFDRVAPTDYLSFRKRGLQTELLTREKQSFSRTYPDLVVDSASIEEILLLLTQEVAHERLAAK